MTISSRSFFFGFRVLHPSFYKRNSLENVQYGFLAAIVILALTGCAAPAPTKGAIGADPGAIEQARKDAITGRANWERLMQSGETVFTVVGETARWVVTDIELYEKYYCRRLLAQRGSASWDDFWVYYDLPNDKPIKQSCVPYSNVKLRPGDDRKR